MKHLIFETPSKTEAIVETIHSHGCVLLKSLFSEDKVTRLLNKALQAYDDWKYMSEKRLMSDYQLNLFNKLNHLPLSSLGPQQKILNELQNSFIQPILKLYFHNNYQVIEENSMIRFQEYKRFKHRVPFHQDQYFLHKERVLNCWIPLKSCGINSPGIEILPIPVDYLLPVHSTTENQSYEFEILETTLEKEIGNYQLWQPDFQAGDVLIFTHYVIHRTYMTKQMAEPRFSIEFRIENGTIT